jgi:hypothetical protein
MKRLALLAPTLGVMLTLASPAAAQEAAPATPADSTAQAAPADPHAKATNWKKGREIPIQYFRPLDKRGINVFETTKVAGAEFTGFKMDFGASFTAQVQDLKHYTTSKAVVVDGKNTNELANIGFGFNNEGANLAMNVQLAPGMRIALTSYLSSRHHNETWVKDGYIQVDESPVDFVPLKALFQIMTVRVGHMEINYGDAHFRRSDNGNAMYNPFVGNYIMDSFTTEIGGEGYLKAKNIIGMLAVTGGEIRGTVTSPQQRGPAFIGKFGYDTQANKNLRVRLTGSMYKTDKALSNTLYGGDRAGSRYFWVMENAQATENGNATSGYINPGFKNKVTAMQFNPFIKYRGLELFGVLERAEGKASAETSERVWKQHALDAVYRFGPSEDAYVGLRYNKATGNLVGIADEVGARRWAVSAGWFLMANVLTKVEYVNQTYQGYPVTNIRNGGEFKGFMAEGVIGF